MRRSLLQRASLATIVAVGAALAVVPGKVEAATSCDGPPCIEVVVHRAGSVDPVIYYNATQLRSISTPQGQTSGATFEAVGNGRQYPTVAVQTPGTRQQVEQERPYEKAADGTYPYVFVDQAGAFGYTRPATAGDAAGTVKAPAGEPLRIDLYASGRPLTNVTLKTTGPRNPRAQQTVTFAAAPGGSGYRYRYVFDDGNVQDKSASPRAKHEYSRSRDYSPYVEVTAPDGSFGASPDATVKVGDAPTPTPTPTKRPDGNGSGGDGSGGRGNGSGSSDTTNSAGQNQSSLGRQGNGPLYGYGNPPTDPFAVPRGSRTLTETEIPSAGSFNGSQQVSGLILAAADVSAPLSDLDTSPSDTTTTRPSAFDDASPLAIALLAAGVLLVLIASAASELTGLSPLTRPRRTRRDR